MPSSSKDKVARHRARVNADPAARAIYLAKRRERWLYTNTHTHTDTERQADTHTFTVTTESQSNVVI